MEKYAEDYAPVSLFKGLKNLLQYWKWFLTSVVLCVLLSVLYLLITQKVYQIDANVLIKNDTEKGSSGGMSGMLQGFSFGSSLSAGGGSVDDELLLISSYSLVRKTIAELGLNVSYTSGGMFTKKDYYNDSPFTVTSVDSLAENFASVIVFKIKADDDGSVKVKAKEGWSTIGEASGKTYPLEIVTTYGKFLVNKTPAFDKEKISSMEAVFMGYNLATEIRQYSLEISIPEEKANGINLSVQETNIPRGKAFLNTMVAIYNREGIDDKNISANRSAEFFDQRIRLNETELREVEQRLQIFKTDNNLTDLQVEAEIMLTKNGDFKEKLIDSEIQFKTVSLIEDFLRDPENQYALAPFNLGVMEKTASEGLQQYNDFLLERARLLRSTTEDNPNVQMLNSQVNIMRNNVLETLKSIKAGFNFARADLSQQEQDFVSRIKKMPEQEREFLEIKREQMIKSELNLYLRQQKEETAMKLANSMEKAKIVDAAYSLSKPVKPNKLFVFSIALILALMIPICSLVMKMILKEIKEVE